MGRCRGRIQRHRASDDCSSSAVVPSATTAPSCNMVTRSAIRRIELSSCETTTTVTERLAQVKDQAVDARGSDRIEPRIRLIAEEKVGIERHRPGERRLLPHAPRELSRQHVDEVRGRPWRASCGPRAPHPPPEPRVLAKRKSDVLEDAHRLDECPALEEHPDFLEQCRQLLFGQADDIAAEDTKPLPTWARGGRRDA